MINIINKKSIQLKILKYLRRYNNKNCSGVEIARGIDGTWVMVSRHLRVFERKKFVVNNKLDKRTNGWSITAKGEDVADQVIKLEKLIR